MVYILLSFNFETKIAPYTEFYPMIRPWDFIRSRRTFAPIYPISFVTLIESVLCSTPHILHGSSSLLQKALTKKCLKPPTSSIRFPWKNMKKLSDPPSFHHLFWPLPTCGASVFSMDAPGSGSGSSNTPRCGGQISCCFQLPVGGSINGGSPKWFGL